MSAAHGVEEEEDHFEAAAEQLTVTIATGTRLPDASLLELYALYKQGSEGPCSRPKPSFLDPKGRTKWKAWHDLGAMPREEAGTSTSSRCGDCWAARPRASRSRRPTAALARR